MRNHKNPREKYRKNLLYNDFLVITPEAQTTETKIV